MLRVGTERGCKSRTGLLVVGVLLVQPSLQRIGMGLGVRMRVRSFLRTKKELRTGA